MAKNVTVLADVNGVQREYNDVKRKAHVGERIKMLDLCPVGGYNSGDTFDVKSVCNGRVDFIDKDGDTRSAVERRYLVLEPTSTVIIDGVRYTEEKRKARVGEKVLVVSAESNLDYDNGHVCTALDVNEDEIVITDSAGDRNALYHREYVVLTPIDEPAPTASAQQTVINLAITVNIQPGADVAQAVADAVKDAMRKQEMARVPAPSPQSAADFVSCALDLLGIAKASKTPQELRDEIVERAKADVAELLDENYPELRPTVWLTEKGGYVITDNVEFVVNREKRVVVALIREKRNNKVIHRGTAKCAPGDVFNSYIGRAIAVRRALGLDVPAEYTNAPQPTGARVGDVVKTKVELGGGWTATLTKRAPEHDNSPRYKNKLAFRHTHDFGWVGDSQFDIIDDSREEVSAVA